MYFRVKEQHEELGKKMAPCVFALVNCPDSVSLW